MTARVRLAWGLSAAIAVGMAVQSAAGVLAQQMYRDVAWVKLTWFGNDLTTLFVVAPILALSLYFARRGSARARLVWVALLVYTVYNYAYYLLGSVLTVLFPLYAALAVGSAIAAVLVIGSLDAESLPAWFDDKTPARRIAAYMLFTGCGLGAAWLAQWAVYVFGGKEPSIGESAFRLVASLDLTMVVPFFVLGGVLLWKRRSWGYLLGVVMNIKGALYTGLLALNSVLAARAGTAGAAAQAPVWAIWCMTACIATYALLRHVRTLHDASTERVPAEAAA